MRLSVARGGDARAPGSTAAMTSAATTIVLAALGLPGVANGESSGRRCFPKHHISARSIQAPQRMIGPAAGGVALGPTVAIALGGCLANSLAGHRFFHGLVLNAATADAI